ncbi:MAG: hypothetical protein PF508_12860 [Spirochaeta sp.]|nr:hypothetical protein [Spirochaeta sp.]
MNTKRLAVFGAVLLLSGWNIAGAQPVPTDAWGMDVDRWSYVSHGFYPLGWSPDGRFAYATFRNFDDATGPFIQIDVVVQNMITDGVVAETSFYESRPQPPSFEEAWEAYGAEVVAFIEGNGVDLASARLQEFPYRWASGVAEAELRPEEYEEILPGEEDFGVIGAYEVWVRRESGAEKRITRAEWDGSVGGFLEVKVGGHFPSPYEARTAVLIVETIRGWEGPPHNFRYRVSGAHLERGF